MSRVGSKKIIIPPGVDVVLEAGVLSVKGKLGELKVDVPSFLSCDVASNTLSLALTDEKRKRDLGKYWGLCRASIANAILGVSDGFESKVSVTGVGYRIANIGTDYIALSAGYSHSLIFELPDGIAAKIESPNLLLLTSFDKQLLGNFAARIRGFRVPEPYKGKGIRVNDEFVRKKEGKK